MKRIIFSIIVLLFVTSCNCGRSVKVKAIQLSDKDLSCKNIVLAINEAEHYRKMARKRQGIGGSKMFLPICWVADYNDSIDGIKSANERIDYLSRIYELLDCGGKEAGGKISVPGAAKGRPAAPRPQIDQPVVRQPALPQQDNFTAPYTPAPVQGFNPNQQMQQYNQMQSQIPNQVTDVDPNLHVHIKEDSSRYVHSHTHNGPHIHTDDGRIKYYSQKNGGGVAQEQITPPILKDKTLERRKPLANQAK